LSYLELNNIGNIKEIEEEEEKIFNKLGKEEPGKDSPLKYFIDFKEINLS